jgi:hypothetical protein
MSRRLPARIAFSLGLLVTSVASAEAPTPVPGPIVDTPAPTKSLAGFELLASVGYGAHTNKVLGMELEPYGATFGVEFGYVFAVGLRLAAYFDYGLGGSVSQEHQPVAGDAFQLTTQASSLNGGASVGYDLWLHFLILRYTLKLGVTSLNWDLGEIPRGTLIRYSGQATQGSKLGFYVAPGLALLWPFGRFEGGLGFDYFAQFEDHIPSGFLGKLLFAVKL